MISEKNYDISFSPSKVFMSDNPIRSKLYCRVFIDKIGEGTWEVVNENEYDVINDSIVFSELPTGKFLSIQVSTTPAELMQSPTENTIIVSIKNEIKEVANIASDIILVSDNITNVNNVGSSINKVNNVSDNITNVNNVSDNMLDIQNAEENANISLNNKNLAKKWADEEVDVEVETGKYSAKHWASKASNILVNGVINDETSSAVTSYSSNKVDSLLSDKATISDLDTELQYMTGVTSNIQSQIYGKQDTLVSNINIKTLNNNSLLGSGNIPITNMSNVMPYHIYNGKVEATNTVVANGIGIFTYTGNTTILPTINLNMDLQSQHGNDVSETFGYLIKIKARSAVGDWIYVDSISGNTKFISSNTSTAEQTDANLFTLSTVGGNTTINIGTSSRTNTNGVTYEIEVHQTTHRKTGVTNHGKTYIEHYNSYTGITISKYEASGLTGHEIPHSLGRKLSIAHFKNLTVAQDWLSFYGQANKYLALNLMIISTDDLVWTEGTNQSFVFNGGGSQYNKSGSQHIMYGWANSYYDSKNTLIGNYEVGTYQGTGVSGNKVTTRGKPAWVMIKRLDNTGNWTVYDNQRRAYLDTRILINTSDSELSNYDVPPSYNCVLNANGFTINQGAQINTSGGKYLYMVVYDNDSGSGKSKYHKATDTTNLTINALVPYANGIDVNGEKVSISYKNETITGLTLTQGENYPYSKNDGTYGVNKYEPMYGALRDRVIAGENPDYFDLETRKWHGTSEGSELVTNGTFDTNTTGWTASSGATLTVDMGNLKVAQTTTHDGVFAYQTLTCIVGKTYKLISSVNYEPVATAGQVSIGTTIGGYDIALNIGIGTKVTTFIAQSTTLYLTLKNNTPNDNTFTLFDNISVFEAVPIIGAEITPRTYLDCVVYADHNVQVGYVEELPKTTYFDLIETSSNRVVMYLNDYGVSQIQNDKRYILENPFGNDKALDCDVRVEIFYQGFWGGTGWSDNGGTGSNAYGTRVYSTSTGIIIKTGSMAVVAGENVGGGAFVGTPLVTSAPARVIVTYKGKTKESR